MRIVLLIALALSLAGCGTTYRFNVNQDAAQLDPANAQPCDPVPDPPPKGSSFGQVYEFSNKMVGLYGECAVRDRGKYDWIKSQGH